MFSERDVWVQSVRRQELEEAAQGHRFAKQFGRPDLASRFVFRPLLNLLGRLLIKLGSWLQCRYSDPNFFQPPAQRLSGQAH